MKSQKPSGITPLLSSEITRRDFVGATLAGAGASLLHGHCPAASKDGAMEWTGFGGVGDYRFSNGNTAAVVSSAHRIRDRFYEGELTNIIDVDETYDVAIVGGGFAGMSALHEFQKRRPDGKCLLLDNHPIFGGFAKSNEFDVDGYRISGPQASINFLLPDPGQKTLDDFWNELGVPDQFQFAPLPARTPPLVYSKSTSGPLYFGEQCATVGYYFENSLTQGKGAWFTDIWRDDLRRAPWPDSFKKELRALRDKRIQLKGDAGDAWLDGHTFHDLVTKVMGVNAQVLPYVTPMMGIAGLSPRTSAYAAAHLIPGLDHFAQGTPQAALGDRWMSFPGGNAMLMRHLVKAVFPDAIQGNRSFEAIASSSINWTALDRSDSKSRMRLGATVIRVGHEGDTRTADRVNVVYEKAGHLYRVRARGVVLAIGSWVGRHIVTELPDDYRTALAEFFYTPILMANVALRNWRFLDRLGFSAGRWFDGFGFFGIIRHPMIVGPRAVPFHPDKPIVMTLYAPLQKPELPLEADGPACRAELFNTSYAEYERQIVTQMQRLFSAGGFEARRDIAGIVLNRWGHAMPSPPPGFFFGKGGSPAPREILRKPFGRIAFGHSELGRMDWLGATIEGKRALEQVLG